MDSGHRHAMFVADTVAEGIEAIARHLEPVNVIAERLAGYLRAVHYSRSKYDLLQGDCDLRVWPEDASIDFDLMMWASRRVPDTHPVLRHWMRGHTGVASVSSLVSNKRAWRNSRAYSLMLDGLGATETAGLPLDRAVGMFHAIGFSRDDDFTSSEMSVLQMAWAPTVALKRHAEHLDYWRASITATDAAPDSVVDAAQLTRREMEVLYLLSTGILASTIASRMLISDRTVHRHLANIYAKLGTHDRLSTVMRAQAMGLLAAHVPPRRAAAPLRHDPAP